jgi:hypothetical protein
MGDGMKRLLFAFLFLLNTQLFGQAIDRLERPWPSGENQIESLSELVGILKSDAQTRILVQKAETQLAAHEIKSLVDILHFCESPKDGVDAQASAHMPVNSTEIRLNFPSKPVASWSASTLEKLKQAYNSKIVKTPFIDFLLIEDHPFICLDKGLKLVDIATILAHELVHMTAMDPFQDQVDLIQGIDPVIFSDRFFKNRVLSAGGEFEAYQVGISAEVRLRAAAGLPIHNSAAEFFDQKGNLTNPKGLRKMVTDLYSPYYKSTEVIQGLITSEYHNLTYKLLILQQNVIPQIQGIELAAAQAEVTRLMGLKKSIETRFPKLFL